LPAAYGAPVRVPAASPLTVEDDVVLEIQGYRQALGYVLAMGEDEYASLDATEIRAMHCMTLSHDPSKSPGRYRKGPIYVRDGKCDQVVYEGPAAGHVPALMDALVGSLHTGLSNDPVVRSALGNGPPEPGDDPFIPRWQRANGPRPGHFSARPAPIQGNRSSSALRNG
jgi:hypothetical protein